MKHFFLILLFMSIRVSAKLTCDQLFTYSAANISQNDTPEKMSERKEQLMFDFIDRFYIQIDRIQILSFELDVYDKNAKRSVDAELVQIKEFESSIHSSIDKLDENIYRKKLLDVERRYQNLTDRIVKYIKAQKITELSDLIQDPALALSGHIYRAIDYQGKENRFQFSAEIIKDVMQSTSSLHQIAAQMSLRSMIKGQIPTFSKGATGIKFLQYDPIVFEVIIVGTGVGKFRLLGYVNDQGVLVVNHFYASSDHTMKNIVQAMDYVLRHRIEDRKKNN